MRMYGALAPWFHLITHPDDYAEEADHILRVARAGCAAAPETLLELGSGGGNMASHLKRHLHCTLTDLSPEMIAVSRSLNPECEHQQGDMRSLDLGRSFDVVLVHDAIGYLTCEADLAAAIGTMARHLKPGGLAILIPDETTETFAPGSRHGGVDAADGRSLRYLEWSQDVEPGATTHAVDYAMLIREPGKPTRVEQDRHVLGLFPKATWLALIEAAGLEPIETGVVDPIADQHAFFTARRRG